MDHVAKSRGQGYTVVEPFIKTLWGQGDPYNFLTPEINGKHTPSGCVATAMSQIMKYYTYPAQGKGMGYYTIEGNSGDACKRLAYRVGSPIIIGYGVPAYPLPQSNSKPKNKETGNDLENRPNVR
jgi:hypothetical protein